MSRVHCTSAYTIVGGRVQQRRNVLPEPAGDGAVDQVGVVQRPLRLVAVPGDEVHAGEPQLEAVVVERHVLAELAERAAARRRGVRGHGGVERVPQVARAE
uniref:Uncharacterized protein n=1 Tax=Oryza brachyantha TaxID=4533 RepID=J3MNX1_ORYBR